MRELSGLLRQRNQAEKAHTRADPRIGMPSPARWPVTALLTVAKSNVILVTLVPPALSEARCVVGRRATFTDSH